MSEGWSAVFETTTGPVSVSLAEDGRVALAAEDGSTLQMTSRMAAELGCGLLAAAEESEDRRRRDVDVVGEVPLSDVAIGAEVHHDGHVWTVRQGGGAPGSRRLWRDSDGGFPISTVATLTTVVRPVVDADREM